MFFKGHRGSTDPAVDDNAHQELHRHEVSVVENKSSSLLPSIFATSFHKIISSFQKYAKTKRPSKLQPAALVEIIPVVSCNEASPATNPRVDTTTTSSKDTANSSAVQRRTSSSRKDFLKRTALLATAGSEEDIYYSNPESLPSLELAFASFKQVYPRFEETVGVDYLRETQYAHLGEDGHVCMDYSGFGLFSQWHQVMEHASSFGLAYISANLPTHALYGSADDGSIESYIRKRIMRYMNVNEAEYCMVFTSSGGSAYKLLAESYPFHVNNRLLTISDYESEAVNWMVASARDRGANIINASFKWPSLRIVASDLKYKLQDKNKKKKKKKKKKEKNETGLFVFPVQSRVTGTKYSYQWMSQAQANQWHVLLDASALGPKDMDSLGLSLFQPEFIITSFYKVFGADPTGFGCLFIKNTAMQSLQTTSRARGVGMVRIVPSGALNSFSVVSEGKIEGGDDGENEDTTAPESMEVDEIEEFVDAYDQLSSGSRVDTVSFISAPVNQSHVRHASFQDRMSGGGSVNSGLNSEVGSIAGSHDDEIATSAISEIEEVGEVMDQGHDGNPRGRDTGNIREGTVGSEALVFPLTRRGLCTGASLTLAMQADAFEEHHSSEQRTSSLMVVGVDTSKDEGLEQEQQLKLHKEDFTPHQDFHEDPSVGRIGEVVDADGVTSLYMQHEIEEDALYETTCRNGDARRWSPLFINPSEANKGVHKARKEQNHEVSNHLEVCPWEEKLVEGGEDDNRLESEDLGSSRIHKGDWEHVLKEGREAGSSSWHRRILSSVQENFEGQPEWGVCEQKAYDGNNGRRMQYWSHGEGINKRAEQYAMSTDGSPVFYEHEEGGLIEDSEPEMMDDDDRVICSGLDHADSQGLSKTNCRLRYLTNWVINALLKLQHPVQTEGQGTPLVHIYGPKVQFDRGASMAFNIFDWNGVLVQPTLVQRLADRSNISLGLGNLCNVIYPEDLQDLRLQGLQHKEKAVTLGGKTDGKLETPRASNANRGDQPLSIPVVTAALGFLTNFEDVYRLWVFVAKFLDVDFVSREGWQYHSINQEMVVL